MESGSAPAHVLVVANQTSAGPALLEAVRLRAQRSPARFTLVMPAATHGLDRVMDPEDADRDESQRRLDDALPLLSEAAGSKVEGQVGDASPLAAIEDAVNFGDYQEIIISTLPRKLSHWLKLDLPAKAAGLGLPVTHIEASH